VLVVDGRAACAARWSAELACSRTATAGRGSSCTLLRDAAELRQVDVGILALATNPAAAKSARGQLDVAIAFRASRSAGSLGVRDEDGLVLRRGTLKRGRRAGAIDHR